MDPKELFGLLGFELEKERKNSSFGDHEGRDGPMGRPYLQARI